MEVATTAERLGFDAVWMFDHLFTPTDLDSSYPYTRTGDYAMTARDPFFDPLGLYGVLAGATERVKLGTGVLIPAYRHPLVLGKILATIANFAPGRVMLGAGAGWMREEFDAVGVPYERRGDRLDEYIRALKTIWSSEPAGFDGEFYSWTEAGTLPAPPSPIPIIVGGHSDRALLRAATHGDGWAVVTQHDQGFGWDAVAKRLDVLDTELERAERSRDGYELLFQSLLWFSDEPNPKLPFTGPPDAISSALERAADLGITMIDLIVFGPTEMIVESAERFAKEVSTPRRT